MDLGMMFRGSMSFLEESEEMLGVFFEEHPDHDDDDDHDKREKDDERPHKLYCYQVNEDDSKYLMWSIKT